MINKPAFGWFIIYNLNMSRGKHLTSRQVFSTNREVHLEENIAKERASNAATLDMLKRASPFYHEWRATQKKAPDGIDYNLIAIGTETLVRYDISPPLEALLLPMFPEIINQFRVALRLLSLTDQKPLEAFDKNATQQLKMRLHTLSGEWVLDESEKWPGINTPYHAGGMINIFTSDRYKATARDLKKLKLVAMIPSVSKSFLDLIEDLEKDEPKNESKRQELALKHCQSLFEFENEYKALF
jgi:hypothetical protein